MQSISPAPQNNRILFSIGAANKERDLEVSG
jgi:hypothetical protein